MILRLDFDAGRLYNLRPLNKSDYLLRYQWSNYNLAIIKVLRIINTTLTIVIAHGTWRANVAGPIIDNTPLGHETREGTRT